jgi:hypothetical protein
MTNASFDGSVLPDAFVGVPYLAGLPYHGNTATITICSLSAGALPPGLGIKGAADPVVTGTVQVTTQTGTQVDGAYSFTAVVGDAAGTTATQAFTMNVHYLTGDQDLSVAAQAAFRNSEAIDNSIPSGNSAGDFPTGPAVPSDIG